MVWIAPAGGLTATFAACQDGITPIREAAMRSQALAHAIPIDQVDLEALDRFLMSDRSPPDSMMLSDLDGFLTGIAIGPELVLPSEWLPLVWGGEAPEFADEGEAKAVLGAIMARYNEILRQLADGSRLTVLAYFSSLSFLASLPAVHAAARRMSVPTCGVRSESAECPSTVWKTRPLPY